MFQNYNPLGLSLVSSNLDLKLCLGSSDRLRYRSIGGILEQHEGLIEKLSIDAEDLEGIKVSEVGARAETQDGGGGYLIQIFDDKGRVSGENRDGDGSLGLDKSIGTMDIVPSRLDGRSSISGGLDKSGCF